MLHLAQDQVVERTDVVGRKHDGQSEAAKPQWAGLTGAQAEGEQDAQGWRRFRQRRFCLFYCPHGFSSILRLKFMHCTMSCSDTYAFFDRYLF